MNDFSISRHGYDPVEVDNYIIRLKADYEAKLSEQKDRIFYLKNQLDTITRSSENELMTALASAVEKAKQIEISSRNIFELETKRLKLLYNKMDALISKMTKDTSLEEIKVQLLTQIYECESSLEKNVELQAKAMSMVDTENPVRKLLQKMNNKTASLSLKNIEKFVESPIEQKQQPQKVKPKPQIKEERVVIKKEQQKVEPIFDNYLKEDSPASKNFESIMFKKNKKNNSVITADLSYPTPNESGFDLKEAVNPKDDLEEIMKAFDFFDDTDKKKKK